MASSIRYLFQRGTHAKLRVMHICRFDQFGNPTMQPVCGNSHGLNFDTTCNLPLGRPICKRCNQIWKEANQ